MSVLIHPQLVSRLPRFFPARCTIQQATVTRASDGQPVATWANLAAHVDLACAVGSSGGQEVKRGDLSYAVSTHRMVLAGSYPTITPTMRAIVDGTTYDILLVEQDSQAQLTRLTCEVVR